MSDLTNGILIVGVSGVTCGGKTTIASKLKELFDSYLPCHVFEQDEYYKDEEDIAVDSTTGLQEWDVIESFHMDKLYSDVTSLIKKWSESADERNAIRGIIIIEGIVLFPERRLNKLFNKKYFMTLPYDVTLQRRRKRVYEPPEVPELFDAHVWPKYVEQRDSLRVKGEDMLEISATKTIDKVYDIIKSDLKQTYWPNEKLFSVH